MTTHDVLHCLLLAVFALASLGGLGFVSGLGNPVERTYPTSIPFTPGGAPTFPLTTNELVETLQFTLSGKLTNAAYTVAPVKRVEAVENLIRNLQIIGNSRGSGKQSDTFTSTDAAFLAYQTRILETTAPDRTDVGTANAEYDFTTTFNKYFGLRRLGGLYSRGFLDTRFLNSLNVNLQFRDVAAMIQPGTGANGNSTISDCSIQVHSIEYVGGPLAVRGTYAKQTQRQFDLSAYNGLSQVFPNAPVGNYLHRQTFKTMAGDVDYADPTDNIFTTELQARGSFLEVKQNNNFSWYTASVDAIRTRMKLDYSLEALPAGYISTEFSTRTQSWQSLLDATKLRSGGLTDIMDTTIVSGSTNTLQITDEEIIVKKIA